MVTKNLAKISKTIALVVMLSACISGGATSPQAQFFQSGDNCLTKEELLAEINKVNDAKKKFALRF